MSGIKYILRNECTTPALITYQNYSNQLWQYQVEFLPGQTRTIWATEGTLSYDLTRTCLRVLSQTIYPPTTTPTPSNPVANVSYKNQTLINISTMPTSDNWEFTVLNWENATITGPVDLGFSSNNWNLYSFNTSLNGWIIIFNSISTFSNKKVYFVDKNGSIKYVYTADTDNWSWGSNANLFAHFVDRDNNKFIFTDFSSTIVYDIPSNKTDFGVDNNFDDGNLEGIIVYQEVNTYSEYILFKPSGYQTLFNYNNNDYSVESIIYYNSNFFVIEVYSQNNDEYSFLNIYNKNGALINSLNIEFNNPTSVNSVTLNNSTIDSNITGTFNVEQSSTDGSGSGTTFQIELDGGDVFYSIGGRGVGYSVGDEITIDGTEFGGISGDDDVTFTVNSLGNFQYTQRDINFFGSGKMQIVYETFNNTEPYYIVIYDGIENEFYTTSHDKNTYLTAYYSYYSYCLYLGNESGNNTTPSEDCYLSFYDDDGSFDGSLYSVDDCDIISWYNSTKEFSVYEFAKGAGYNYYISLYNYYLGNSLMLYSNRDDNYINYEVFQPTGHTTVNVVLTSSLDTWNFYNDWCGEAFLSRFNFLGSNENLFTLYKYDGTRIDSLYNLGGYVDWQSTYNMLYMVNNTNQIANYWNSSLNSIQSTPYLGNWNYETNYYTTSNINNGNIYAVNTDNYQSIIYTKNSKSVTRLIPYVGPTLNFRIGRQVAALLTNNNSGKLVVKVYDLNYNLLNTVTTNETSYNNFNMSDNRIYLVTEDGSNYINYLITASTFRKATVSDYSNSWDWNDWNDWC